MNECVWTHVRHTCARIDFYFDFDIEVQKKKEKEIVQRYATFLFIL